MIPEKFNFIKRMVNPKKGEKILNIGIGVDPFIERKFENDCVLWTADVDDWKIENARGQLKRTTILFLDLEKRISIYGDRHFFDKVILLEVLEHVHNDKKALRTINKLLNRGGELIISVPEDNLAQAISPMNWLVHYRHYSTEKIVSMLKEAGFEIEEIEHPGSWLFSINLYLSLILRYVFRQKLKSGDILFRKYYGRSWCKGRASGMSVMIKARKVR